MLPAELRQMLEALEDADPIYHPSAFWRELNARHLSVMFSADGLSRFKRTVNDQYFQFGLYAFPNAMPGLLLRWLRHPDPTALLARFERGGVRYERLLAIAVALYANALASGPYGGLLDFIYEPPLGDPLYVRYGRRRVTQDLCHSLEEYGSIKTALRERALRRVAEIGAGYGRLAYFLLQAEPAAAYYVVDIPPALYLSQWYLTETLAGIPAFRFRPFDDYSHVAAEMSRARLVFLEPQQLELLPDDHFDIVFSISTFAEMRFEQVANFLRLVDRTCSGAFYLKQWRRWRNPIDDVTIAKESYPFPKQWRKLFERSPLVPRQFFEALYLCRPGAAVGADARCG